MKRGALQGPPSDFSNLPLATRKRGPLRAPLPRFIHSVFGLPIFSQKLGKGRTPVARQKIVMTIVVEKAHQKMKRW